MQNQLLTTLILLGLVLPIVLYDGGRYRILLITIILLIPFYQTFIYFRYIIFVFIMVIVWVRKDRQLLDYQREPINKALMLFFILALISSLASFNISPLTVESLQDLVFFYLFFLMCLVSIKRQINQTILARTLLCGLLISVFVQTMQSLNFEVFYLYNINKLNGNTGMGYKADSQLIRFWGTFGNSLTFSAYLAVVGVFLFAYYHNSFLKRTRILSFAILGITIYSITLTAGRTAFVSVLISLLAYAFFKNGKKALMLCLSVVILTFSFSKFLEQAASIGNLNAYTRITTFNDDKSFRTELWERSLPVLLNNPLFGSGPGNLTNQISPLIYKIYVADTETKAFAWGHIENTYLTVLYTFGLLGFGCFIYMLGRSFLYSIRAKKEINSLYIRQTGYGLITAWIAMAINMISNPAFVSDHRMIALMLLFVAISISVGWKGRSKLFPQTNIHIIPLQQAFS